MAIFKKNLCNLDRGLRGIIGICVTTYGVFFGAQIGDWILQTIVIIFGLLNLISLATGWCPVYQLAKIQTCSVTDK